MKRIFYIQVDRDSVCMGDDCEDHREKMKITEDMKVLDLLKKLSIYVPSMSDVIWAIQSNRGICGYIMTDYLYVSSFELAQKNNLIQDMNISEIYCRYYYPSIFDYIDGKTGNKIEKYVECKTFLEKVKKDNG